MIYFSNMCYDMYCLLVKFQFETPYMHEEMKETNCIRGNLNQRA